MKTNDDACNFVPSPRVHPAYLGGSFDGYAFKDVVSEESSYACVSPLAYSPIGSDLGVFSLTDSSYPLLSPFVPLAPNLPIRPFENLSLAGLLERELERYMKKPKYDPKITTSSNTRSSSLDSAGSVFSKPGRY